MPLPLIVPIGAAAGVLGLIALLSGGGSDSSNGDGNGDGDGGNGPTPGPFPPLPPKPGPGPGPSPSPKPTPADIPSREDVVVAACIAWADWPGERPLNPDPLAAAALASLGTPGTYPITHVNEGVEWTIWALALEVADKVQDGEEECPLSPEELDPAVEPFPDPTEGGYYTIRKAQPLTAIARKLRPTVSGAERLEIARIINSHARNVGLQVETKNAWNAKHIGPTMISFFPDWRANPQYDSQRFEPGQSYATIYIPQLDGHPKLGQTQAAPKPGPLKQATFAG